MKCVTAKKPRQKKCRAKGCSNTFTPRNGLQRACGLQCALSLGRDAEEKRATREAKERRRHTRRRLEELKTTQQLTKEAQKEFNAWVRERDHDKPCISCDAFPGSEGLTGGSWDCGHYRSTGANPELRFEPLNAHKQCKKCNQHLSGNVVNYRIHLERRIGTEKLKWLEGHHESKNCTRDDLRAIRDEYRGKARELRKARQKLMEAEVS